MVSRTLPTKGSFKQPKSAAEKSRIGKKSKRKGRAGEQEIAKLLTAILYPEGDGEVRRTPMSGAWHGMSILTGDLICLKDEDADAQFPFYWSVKWHKRDSIPAFAILAGNFSVLKKWLQEAQAMCKGKNYYTFLVWKSDATSWFVCMDLYDYEQLREAFMFPNDTTLLISKWPVDDRSQFGLVNMPLSTFGSWIGGGIEKGTRVLAKATSVK